MLIALEENMSKSIIIIIIYCYYYKNTVHAWEIQLPKRKQGKL